MNSSKRIGGRVLSVVLAIMMVFSLMAVGFTASAATVEVGPTGATTTIIYLKPNSNWTQASARFAAYFFGCSATTWVDMVAVENDSNIYEASIPAGDYSKVIFARMNPATTENNWDNKWDQSADITLPSDGTNLFTIADGAWGGATGTWSSYTPPKAPEAGEASTVQIAGDFTTWDTAPLTMVYTEDTNLVTASVELEAGEYGFKVIDGGIWKGNNDSTANIINDTVTDLPVANYGSGDNITLTATGGTYTFTYNLSADTISVGYTAPEVPTTTQVTETPDPEVPTTTQVTETPDPEVPTTTQATDPEVPVEPAVFDGFYWEAADGLYAYAGTVAEGSIPDDNAWQRWDSPNSNTYRYFYLPASASATEVIIYNTFANDVTVNGTVVPSMGIATVAYTDSEVLTVTGAESKATGVKIMKSDADATLFINNTDAMTAKDKDGGATLTAAPDAALYSFLTGGTKNREAGSLGGAVADGEGVRDASVKKIKGRGNSTWRLAKKPFNITYSSAVEIDNMLAGKKWSLLANAQESSLIRNRIVYDMANEVSMKYACDSRFVDWFVNGEYLGSYQMTQKIEMGKGTVMPDLTEPEVEDVVEDDGTITPPPTADFDFILEMDTAENANSSGDMYWTTSRQQDMTYKTPDEPTAEQQAFIKSKYQAVEDALYNDDLQTLEKLVDMDDFAKAYLINEVAKNIDAGVTSTYFTYSAAEDKFYLSPVWDYDNALGNSNNTDSRVDMNGNQLDLTKPDGWYTRELKHYARDDRSVFSKAWYTTSANAAGETFADIVKRVWNSDFADLVDILEGTATANGRLQTVDSYLTSLEKSGNWNYQYAGWDMVTSGWISDHSTLTMYDYNRETGELTSSTKNYDKNTLEGQAAYAGDWTISRLNWMDAQYSGYEIPTKTVYVGVISHITDVVPQVHYWGGADGNGDANLTATGETFNYTFDASAGYWTDEQTFTVYSTEIPADATGIKLHAGDAWADVDLTYAENQIILYFNYNGDKNLAVPYTAPVEPTTTEATEPTTEATEPTTEATEPTTEATEPTTEATEPEVPVETEVISFVDGTSSSWIQNAGAVLILYDYVDAVAYLGETTDNLTWNFTVPKGLTTINFFRCASGTTVETFSADDFWNSWTTGVSQRDAATQSAYTATDNNVGTWNDEVVALQYFVRGTFNSWGTDIPMTENEDGTWTAVVTLVAGTYEYKIGTADWGTAYPDGANATFTLDVDADVTFTLDADNNVTATWDNMPDVTYSVTWDTTDTTFTVGAEVTEVVEGESFTFTVTAAEGYEIATVLNGTTVIEAVDGVYTIENVTADINLTIVTKVKEVVPATTYTVVFLGANGQFLKVETVEAGQSATAPLAPGYQDNMYIYTFSGWDKEFSNVQEDLVVSATYTSEIRYFSVTFLDMNGEIIETVSVACGNAAEAPEAPVVDGYTFTGWSEDITNITESITVTAQYKKVVVPVVPTHGALKVEVVGGNGFTIAVNGGTARPQGASYNNSKLPIGASVTLTATNSGNNTFVGWMGLNGAIVSTELEYTFTSSGNDYFKAQFTTVVEGVNLVTFTNDKAAGGKGQILDMQYYAAGDEISFPDGPSQAGYDFAGWSMTAEEIQTELAAGRDVTVIPTWTVKQVYYNVVVNGGSVTDYNTKNEEGQYLANRGVEVTADAAEAGMKFAYWVDQNGNIKSYNTVYTFYASYDIELTAVYVAEDAVIEYEVPVSIVADPTTAGEKITYTFSWEVPEASGYTFVRGGMLVVDKENYNAETFYYGTSDSNVTPIVPSAAQAAEMTYNITKTKSYVGHTYVAVAFVTYTDAQGVEHTIYSELVEVEKVVA